MKAYEEYKNTDIVWIKEIPSHWESGYLKHLLVSNDGGTWGELTSSEKGVMALRSTEITIDGRFLIQEPAFLKLNRDEVRKYFLIKGDLLVTKSSGSEHHIGKTALVDKEIEKLRCVYSNFMQRLRPSRKCYPKYLHYYLNSDVSRSQYHFLNKSSIGLGNLGKEVLGEVLIPFFPLPEQRQIAAYLDYKTKQIDRFIANRKKQIELLEEQATKVMENLLLVGTRKQEQRSVDFPYLDRIPASWEFMKLNHLANITRLAGYEYTSLWKTDEKGEIIALRGQNVGFNCLLDIENADRISNKLSIRLNRSRLYRNDIVFPCVGTVGKAVLIEEDNRYHINQNIAKITPSYRINPLYLTYILNSYFCYHQIIHFNTSDAQPNVLVRDLRRFMIPVPSIKEQDEIVQEINEQRAKHSELITKYKKQIDLMQEYKTSLISKAVTGKIDVREWQPKQTIKETV